MSAPLLVGFNPALLLLLNLGGTFVFGLSGGMAGVRKQLDVFGAIVLAVVVGIAGGTICDLLIGIAPTTFRDWRYLAVAGAAGLVTSLAHPVIERLESPIEVLDAAGLALFCVTGAVTALEHGLGVLEAVILGALTGVGGGVMRDVLVGEIPAVLRGGLYAVPALLGAGIVVGGFHSGHYGVVLLVVAAAVCFVLRMAGLRYGLELPGAADVALSRPPRRRARGTTPPPDQES